MTTHPGPFTGDPMTTGFKSFRTVTSPPVIVRGGSPTAVRFSVRRWTSLSGTASGLTLNQREIRGMDSLRVPFILSPAVGGGLAAGWKVFLNTAAPGV